MASDKFIEELAKKLKDHTSEVNPDMWRQIATNLGTSATSSTVATGFGIVKGTVVVGIVLSTVLLAYVASNGSQEKGNDKIANTTQISQNDSIAEGKEDTVPASDSKKERVIESSNLAHEQVLSLEQPNENVVPKRRSITVDNSGMNSESIFKPIDNVKGIVVPMAPEPIRSIPVSRNEESNPNLVNEIKSNNTISKTIQEPSELDLNVVKSKAEFKRLPNIFTPNGDGSNDYFFVESEGLVNYNLVILNDKNETVWKTTDPNEKWDGRDHNGNYVSKGTYIYFITAEDGKGTKQNKYQRLQIF